MGIAESTYVIPENRDGRKQAINLLLWMAEQIEAGAMSPASFRLKVETETTTLYNSYGPKPVGDQMLVLSQNTMLEAKLPCKDPKELINILNSDKWNCSQG